jgi:poly [ADP-ribose] polymerase
MMTDTLIKLDLDVKRMPLGKISRNMIAQAHEVLRALSASPGQLTPSEVMARSSEFWTMVPYATKRNVRPPVLDNVAAITQCSQLLDTLENIEIAGTILQRSSNEVDIYKSLGITLTYLESGPEVDVIRRYVGATHGSTHRYRLDLIDVYRVDKPSHDVADTQKLFDSTPNHRLLFHGSRMANFMGILAEGLRIPKPSQVSNGSTLGRGIYFADAVSKSYNYTCSSETDHTGFMVLCEVALGNPHVVYNCCDRDGVDPGQHSRWAKGNWSPDEAQFNNLGSVVVPCGSLIENPQARHSSFLYNEYVVYNTHQYRFRYLIYLRDAK